MQGLRKRVLKLLIVNPPVVRSQQWLHPAMILLYAACFEKVGFEVRIIDAPGQGLDWNALEQEIKKEAADMCLLHTSTNFVYENMYVAHLAKKANPGCIVFAGGPHFACVPELSLRTCRDIDFCVIGDSLNAILEISGQIGDPSFSFRNVRGLAFIDENDRYVENEPGEIFTDIDSLPLPAYHLVDMNRFFLPLIGGKRGVTLITSWGCPYRCLFCFTTDKRVWGNRWRGRSAKRLADEVELLYHDYGKNIFWFYDNDFFLVRERNIDFVYELERRRLDIEYWVQTRADIMLRDRDLVPSYRRTGLSWALVGFESPSQEQLDRWQKKLRISDSLESIDLLNRYGVVIQAMLLFGDRYDSYETWKNLDDFCQRIMDRVYLHFHAPIPFPGSELFMETARDGLLEEYDFSKYDFHLPTTRTEKLSRSEVLDLLWWLKLKYASLGNYLRMTETLEIPEKIKTGLNMLSLLMKEAFSNLLPDRRFMAFKKEMLERQRELMLADPVLASIVRNAEAGFEKKQEKSEAANFFLPESFRNSRISDKKTDRGSGAEKSE